MINLADSKDVTVVPTEIVVGKLICEGKTKEIFEIDGQQDLVLVRSKDRITAFNAARQHDLEGKASLSNVATSLVFDFLSAVGLETHFVRRHSNTEFVALRCAMIQLEWVARRIATGSFLKRHSGVAEGLRFAPPKLEIFFKDDELDDPQWSEEMVVASRMVVSGVEIGRRQVEQMSRVTLLVFELLERAWQRLGCTLVDMKVEFGVNAKGDIVLADVIDCDSWRLWPAGDRRLQVDKQFYRDLKQVSAEDLGQLKKNYEWVSQKLCEFVTPPKGRAVVLMGSYTDKSHGDAIAAACFQLGVPAVVRVCSAHKTTATTLAVVAEYEADGVPTVFVAAAGRSNGLGPVVSGNTSCAVVNCPPLSADCVAQDIWSSLRLPSGLGCATVLSPAAAALHVATVIGTFDHMVSSRLRVKQLHTFIETAKKDDEIQRDMEAKYRSGASETPMNGYH